LEKDKQREIMRERVGLESRLWEKTLKEVKYRTKARGLL
jgi:hypothetical protein